MIHVFIDLDLTGLPLISWYQVSFTLNSVPVTNAKCCLNKKLKWSYG